MYIIYTLHIAAQMAPKEQQLAFHASSRYHNLTQPKLGDSQGVEGAVGLMVSLMMQHSFHCKILLTNAAVCWQLDRTCHVLTSLCFFLFLST